MRQGPRFGSAEVHRRSHFWRSWCAKMPESRGSVAPGPLAHSILVTKPHKILPPSSGIQGTCSRRKWLLASEQSGSPDQKLYR